MLKWLAIGALVILVVIGIILGVIWIIVSRMGNLH